tara:strand:- start:373 stop:594 length:222 start_codon:yes stop_codon:yes gene_type:complete
LVLIAIVVALQSINSHSTSIFEREPLPSIEYDKNIDRSQVRFVTGLNKKLPNSIKHPRVLFLCPIKIEDNIKK